VSRLSRVRSMSWSDRAEHVHVTALAAAAELCVRLLPVARSAQLFGVRLVAGESPTMMAELPPWAVGRLRVVRRVMRHWPVDGTCLRESLVAGRRLRSLRPVLKVGVDKGPSGVTAHAWIEIANRSLDPSSSQYAELTLAAS